MARQGKTAGRRAEFMRQHALAQTMGSALRLDLLRGIQRFKQFVDPSELAAALRTGNFGAVLESLPWHKLDQSLDPALERMRKAVTRGAQVSFESLPAPVRTDLRYDVSNMRVDDYVRRRLRGLKGSVQEGTLAAVGAATRRAFTHGINPVKVAKEIKGSIGLNARQATALANYRARLESGPDPVAPKRVEAMTSAYEDRLLSQRSIMIARTEIRFAQNAGQQEVWQSAASDGLLPKGTRRMWVEDGRPCKELCHPMDGKTIALDALWKLPDGRRVQNPVEAHPNCMCIESLTLGG